MMLLNTSPQSDLKSPCFAGYHLNFVFVFSLVVRQKKSGTNFLPTKSSLSFALNPQLPPKKNIQTKKHQPQLCCSALARISTRFVSIGPHLHRLHQPFCFCSLPAGGSKSWLAWRQKKHGKGWQLRIHEQKIEVLIYFMYVCIYIYVCVYIYVDITCVYISNYRLLDGKNPQKPQAKKRS